MALSRRDFLRLGGVTAVTAAATGCSVVGTELAQPDLPETLVAPPSAEIDPAWRLLNRAGFGAAPGVLARVRQMGIAAYLDEQLHPDNIDDGAADFITRGLTLYHMDPTQLVEQDKKDAMVELIGSTLLRPLYSKRQLYEAMVEFWSDHFNIYVRKNEVMPMLKLMDDRDVIRPFALGKFRDLLFASARSPAMLVYLDNVRNEKSHPNENYARELLELHTMGVNGGYTQHDIQELARALTGWTVGRRGRNTGKWIFNEEQHDDGKKQILDVALVAGEGVAGVERVLEMLVVHPSTANFIATKLVRRFVADEPPVALVERVANTFLETDGNIKSMLRVIFLSDEFVSAPMKLKRPFTFMVSAMRVLNTRLRIGRNREIGEWLMRLGQLPFHWPPPDGYPDVAASWATNLLPRWNFALALVHGEIPGANPPLEALVQAGGVDSVNGVLDLFAGLGYGRSLTPSERRLFSNYVNNSDLSKPQTQNRLKDSVALMLASPAFQWT